MTEHLPTDKRKMQIVEAFGRIVREKGFAEITMEDVAQEAQISKGAIYHHFDSKENIALAYCHSTTESMFAMLDDSLKRYDNFRDLMLVGGIVMLKQAVEIFGKIEITAHLSSFEQLQSDVRVLLVTDHYRIQDYIRGILDRAVQRGEINVPDTQAMAIAMNAIFSGFVMDSKVLPLEVLQRGWIAFSNLLLETGKSGGKA